MEVNGNKGNNSQPTDRQTLPPKRTHTRTHTLQQRNTKILWSHWHMEWLECWDGVQLEAKLKKPTQMNERTSEWGDDEGVVAIGGGGVGVELLVVLCCRRWRKLKIWSTFWWWEGNGRDRNSYLFTLKSRLKRCWGGSTTIDRPTNTSSNGPRKFGISTWCNNNHAAKYEDTKTTTTKRHD